MDQAEYITKTAEEIISSFLKESIKKSDDGTGYINSVKIVIEGFKFFLENHIGIKYSEKRLKNIHKYSKELWVKKIVEQDIEEKTKSQLKSDNSYYNYCFEHIFKNGVYPL